MPFTSVSPGAGSFPPVTAAVAKCLGRVLSGIVSAGPLWRDHLISPPVSWVVHPPGILVSVSLLSEFPVRSPGLGDLGARSRRDGQPGGVYIVTSFQDTSAKSPYASSTYLIASRQTKSLS